MKKKLLILLLLATISSIFAKDVELKFKMIDGTEKTEYVDSLTDSYTFVWTYFPNKEIVSMEGFEKLNNLSALFFYYPKYYGDWMFLKKIPKLKKFASDIKKSSLKFLENLNNIETLELNIIYNDEDFENLKSTIIDLKKLTKLKKIWLRIDNEKNVNMYRMDFIPKFINVQNKPELIISDNRIESITDDEIELLKQYSNVVLDYNPITRNEEELSKLRNAKINFSAEY